MKSQGFIFEKGTWECYYFLFSNFGDDSIKEVLFICTYPFPTLVLHDFQFLGGLASWLECPGFDQEVQNILPFRYDLLFPAETSEMRKTNKQKTNLEA